MTNFSFECLLATWAFIYGILYSSFKTEVLSIIIFQVVKSKTGPGPDLRGALWHSGNYTGQVSLKNPTGVDLNGDLSLIPQLHSFELIPTCVYFYL